MKEVLRKRRLCYEKSTGLRYKKVLFINVKVHGLALYVERDALVHAFALLTGEKRAAYEKAVKEKKVCSFLRKPKTPLKIQLIFVRSLAGSMVGSESVANLKPLIPKEQQPEVQAPRFLQLVPEKFSEHDLLEIEIGVNASIIHAQHAQ